MQAWSEKINMNCLKAFFKIPKQDHTYKNRDFFKTAIHTCAHYSVQQPFPWSHLPVEQCDLQSISRDEKGNHRTADTLKPVLTMFSYLYGFSLWLRDARMCSNNILDTVCPGSSYPPEEIFYIMHQKWGLHRF